MLSLRMGLSVLVLSVTKVGRLSKGEVIIGQFLGLLYSHDHGFTRTSLSLFSTSFDNSNKSKSISIQVCIVSR